MSIQLPFTIDIGAVVERPLYLDNGEWHVKGDDCLKDSPMRRGVITGREHEPTGFKYQKPVYTVRWYDGTTGRYFALDVVKK